MDDFAVARTGAGADRMLGLDEDDLAARASQCTRDGQADDAGPDDDCFGFFHAARLWVA